MRPRRFKHFNSVGHAFKRGRYSERQAPSPCSCIAVHGQQIHGIKRGRAYELLSAEPAVLA
jgi:hypothetical protein